MAILTCKVCGGELEVTLDQKITTCKYCRTAQTLPKLGGEDNRRENLYNRAGHFRRNNEFDKAMGIYEQLLNEDTTDSEAYWSIILCKYGIEYVEDPASGKRVPTVNRTQYTSIFDDDNYKSALASCSPEQKSIYEAEAREINEIQKGILAISQREEPFDVFICYKETDKDGRRTRDSVLANDIYHQLTAEGYKVFFSRITLEDKLGEAYEPYIFAALNSAKVMLVLSTKPEYFSAVWVKNEWSRYLTLVKESRGKRILIPAYKDMDPYDLPEEFSHLQAQDMGKLGFMQDLIRGIGKIIGKKAEPTDNSQNELLMALMQELKGKNEPAAPKVDIAALNQKAFMLISRGDFSKASECLDEILGAEPKNARANLGKLMCECKVTTESALGDGNIALEDRKSYNIALAFADDALAKRLKEYNEKTCTRAGKRNAVTPPAKAMNYSEYNAMKMISALPKIGEIYFLVLGIILLCLAVFSTVMGIIEGLPALFSLAAGCVLFGILLIKLRTIIRKKNEDRFKEYSDRLNSFEETKKKHKK